MPLLPSVVLTNWTNQDLVLYHGTLEAHVASLRGGINVNAAPPWRRTDFGRGFYTTTLPGQARTWARSLALRRSGQRPRPRPAVVRFQVKRDDLASLQAVWFVVATPGANDYWSLVSYCRGGGAAHARTVHAGWYDVAIGPVAASRRRRLSLPASDQISFHTRTGAALLDRGMGLVVVLDRRKWRRLP